MESRVWERFVLPGFIALLQGKSVRRIVIPGKLLAAERAQRDQEPPLEDDPDVSTRLAPAIASEDLRNAGRGSDQDPGSRDRPHLARVGEHRRGFGQPGKRDHFSVLE